MAAEGVRLDDAAESGNIALRQLAFAIRAEAVTGGGARRPCQGLSSST